jgi:uncharacterized membrane protein YgdD (TMEM256/DUF423 family)
MILVGLAIYLVPPLIVAWAWARWATRPKLHSLTSNLSLLGLILATASAVLAILTIALAQVHDFPYYDPVLLRIFSWGALLSLVGIVLGIGGIWRPSSLRWYAPVSGLCMLVFWIVMASRE